MIVSSFKYDPQFLPDYIESLKARMRIAVLYGGNKDEPGAVIHSTINPRPWKSYRVVAEDICSALVELGFQKVWLLCDDIRLLSRLEHLNIHLAWLNSGGVQGYEPLTHTPSFMEMAGIPYIGHDPLTAGVLDNKLLFKQKLLAIGLPTPPFVYWSPVHGEFSQESPRIHKLLAQDTFGPYIVKPVSGRASLNVEFICSKEELAETVRAVYDKTQQEILIEEYLPGREYCISLCGCVVHRKGQYQRLPAPFAFAALERKLEKGEMVFTSMDMKAITKDRARLLNQPEDENVRQCLTLMGQTLYTEFNLCSMVRADLRATHEGKLFFLECNPKPDLKRPDHNVTSLTTLGLEAEGMVYTDLILSLLADRLDFLFRYRARSIQHLINLL